MPYLLWENTSTNAIYHASIGGPIHELMHGRFNTSLEVAVAPCNSQRNYNNFIVFRYLSIAYVHKNLKVMSLI